jgi:hypothetical protein
MVGFCRGGGSDVTPSKWEAESIIVQYDGISFARNSVVHNSQGPEL